MNRVMLKTFFLVLMACSMGMAANAMAADVYKVVDEDGNVTYTDRPPPDGSKPIKLAPISVIEAPTYEQPAKTGAKGEEGDEMSLKSLRRKYSDFAIVAPQQEESVWHPEGSVPVVWRTGAPLQKGMKVTVFIDGNVAGKSSDPAVGLPRLDRGEHRVEAQLTDAKNRRIATAEPVIFYIRRPGVRNSGARPAS